MFSRGTVVKPVATVPKKETGKNYKTKEINGHTYAILRLDGDNYYRYVEEYRLFDIKRIAGDLIKPEDLLAICYGEGSETINGEGYACLDTAIGFSNSERGAYQFLPNKTNNEFSTNFQKATEKVKERLLFNGYNKNSEYARRCAIGAHNVGSYAEKERKCTVPYGLTALNRSKRAENQGIFNF